MRDPEFTNDLTAELNLEAADDSRRGTPCRRCGDIVCHWGSDNVLCFNCESELDNTPEDDDEPSPDEAHEAHVTLKQNRRDL